MKFLGVSEACVKAITLHRSSEFFQSTAARPH